MWARDQPRSRAHNPDPQNKEPETRARPQRPHRKLTTMLNSIALVGRLTRDPELRHTNNDRPVCELRLAVDGRGEEPACFIDVICFDAGANACHQHLAKGRMVGVEGRLILDEWTTPEGDKRSRHRVIGQVKFLPDGTRPTSQEAAEPEPAVA